MTRNIWAKSECRLGLIKKFTYTQIINPLWRIFIMKSQSVVLSTFTIKKYKVQTYLTFHVPHWIMTHIKYILFIHETLYTEV